MTEKENFKTSAIIISVNNNLNSLLCIMILWMKEVLGKDCCHQDWMTLLKCRRKLSSAWGVKLDGVLNICSLPYGEG